MANLGRPGLGPVARGGMLIVLLAAAGLAHPGVGPTPATLEGLGLSALLPDDNTTSRDVETTLQAWMHELQVNAPGTPADGAVLVHHTVAHSHAGTDYWRIVPYSSSQGMRGLLLSEGEAALPAAEAWIDWYVRHMDDRGVVLDQWMTADGQETDCPPGQPTLCRYTDAEDSTAATFLWMAATYADVGGDRAAAFLDGHRDALIAAADVITGLQQANGLTWARADYAVMYTMDNSESYAGLDAMARLASSPLGDSALAAHYRTAADAVAAGIEEHLWHEGTGRYVMATHPQGQKDATDLLTWYPGTVPVAWPHLWGATDPMGDRAQDQMAQIRAAWSFPRPDWRHEQVDSTGFLWPSFGHAAFLAGDVAGATDHMRFVVCQRAHPTDPTWFDWPFDAMDGGWLLTSFAAGLEPRPC